MKLDRRRAAALFRLALTFVAHLASRVWRRARRLPLWRHVGLGSLQAADGQAAFETYYRPDGIYGLAAAERALLPRLGECVQCGLCDPVCPVLQSPAGRGFVGPQRLVAASGRLLPAARVWLDAFLCVRCRACEAACPQAVPVDGLVSLMRRASFESAPEAVPSPIRTHVETAPAAASRRPEKGGPPTIAERPADYVLVFGCEADDEARAGEAALLERLGISVATIGDGACCGAVEASCGVVGGAEGRVDALLAALRGRGAFQVATSDPRCYVRLKTHPRYRAELQVYHVLELVLDRLSPMVEGPRVAYHDPLELRDFPGLAEVARDVIKRAGGRLVAPAWPGRLEARCAGTEGATFRFVPELGRDLGRRCLQDARAAGAEFLLTTDALARAHLAGLAKEKGGGPAVHTVAEWILRRAGAGAGRGTEAAT